MRPVLATVLLVTLSTILPGQGTVSSAEIQGLRERLLEGVESIHKPGVPASICTLGPSTFPIYLGRDGAGHALPVVAGALHGRGRVVLFGHGGYLSGDAVESTEHDSGRLIQNLFDWLAESSPSKRPRVAVIGNRAFADALGERRIRAESVGWGEALSGDFQTIVHNSNDWGGRERVDQVLDYVEKGGSFLGGGLRWGWEQLNPGKDPYRDFDANVFAQSVGLAFGIGTLNDIGPRLEDEELYSLGTHAERAAQALFAPSSRRETDERSAQWGKTVVTAARSVNPEGSPFLASLYEAAERYRGAPPSPDAPLKSAEAHRRVAWTLADLRERAKAPADVEAMPGSELFPGAPERGAQPTTIKLRLRMDRPGWTGTGIWIPAGTQVRLRLQPEPPKGLRARIGCHTDELWGKDSWSRHPDIAVRVDLVEAVTTVATPYGGLLFLEHEDDLDQTFGLTVEGGVRAPRFVRGESNKKWNDERQAPGPWAELVGENLCICVPSEHVRGLENAEDLMAFWDEALGYYEELDQRPVYVRKERFVTDVQISAGYMHSGYPIMMHLDVAPVLTDLEQSRTGSHGGVWGFWHELGHNRQLPTWTFGGTGEVTNNLFALFVIERHQGLAPSEQPQIKNNRRDILRYLKDPDFDTWKKKPFTALAMYAELQAEFGWEAFQKVFRGYLDAAKDELPKSDADKRDQWMTRFSRVVGRDLSPFFDRWGVPVSGAAKSSLADLEPWDGR